MQLESQIEAWLNYQRSAIFSLAVEVSQTGTCEHVYNWSL